MPTAAHQRVTPTDGCHVERRFLGATLALARSASEHLKIGFKTLRALGSAPSG
jgi:hypothetical protein